MRVDQQHTGTQITDTNMETGNITTKTMNLSHANITKENQEDLHIAGSHALCVFINTVSMLWLGVFSWLTFMIMKCYIYKRMKISPDKYRHLKKSAKTFWRVWAFINFVILWLNMPVIIYCYTGSRNCVLYYEDETSMTNAAGMLILCAATTYVVQLFENIVFHRRKYKESNDVLITTLHDHLLQLIYWQKPVIKWTATCYHTIGKGDTVETHNEVILCSNNYDHFNSLYILGFYQNREVFRIFTTMQQG